MQIQNIFQNLLEIIVHFLYKANHKDIREGIGFSQRTVTLTRKYLRCGVTNVRGGGYEILRLGHVSTKT